MRNKSILTIVPTEFLLALLMLTFTLTASFAQNNPVTDNQSVSSSLTEVDSKYVCMMTNRLFPKEQIAVVVEDKTYYGCCEMCKARIKNKPQNRVSTDPVTGKEVDKATSIIGASADGSVYYFENQDNLAKYNETAAN